MKKIEDILSGDQFSVYEKTYKTGISKIDEAISINNSCLYTIAGRGDVDKTSVLIDFALGLAKENDVYIFSLRMSKEILIKLMLQHIKDIDILDLLYGRSSKEDIDKIYEGYDILKKLRIYIDDTNRSSNYIFEEIKKIHHGVVLIDGFEYMDVSDEDKGAKINILTASGYDTRCSNGHYLKNLAISHYIPIIVTTDVLSTNEPIICRKELIDICNLWDRSNVVMLLNEELNDGKLEIIIDKNDLGRTKFIELQLDSNNVIIK